MEVCRIVDDGWKEGRKEGNGRTDFAAQDGSIERSARMKL